MSIGELLHRRWTLGGPGQRLKALPRTPIREATDEAEAKIVGTLRYDGEPLSAPLSGRPCACWEVFVEEGFADETIWHPLIRRHGFQSFWVDDETGAAWVSPKAWGYEVVLDHRRRSWLLRAPPSALLEFLKDNGLPTTGLGSERQLRWREGVLEAGERVAVFGPCRWAPDPEAQEAGYREAPTRLELGSEISGVIVSDDARVMG